MRREFWRHSSRGRRPSGKHSFKDGKALEYLAIIAVKYKIDSSELFEHIREAWNQEESKCEQMVIRCREKSEDSAVFLFMAGHNVVGQFSISTRILQGNDGLEDYTRMISTVRGIKVAKPKIEDLKAGMKHVNLRVRVLDISKPKTVYTRLGTRVHVSNALVSDETGTIRMSLWNEQINTISKGDVVKIENGNVASFKGERQLRIGRNGSLHVIE
jgi:replication factor A1